MEGIKDMEVKVMEKCPKCRDQFPSKSGFLTTIYKGEIQQVCPSCYQYLNYKLKQLEKKKKDCQ